MLQKNHYKLIYGLIGLLVFAYVLTRAITLGITYDEAWTLRDFVPLSVYHIFSFEPCDANNQILNTLLIKFFFLTGNHSLVLARMPNVLAFVLYGYFIFRIAKNNLNRFFGICLFIILMINPFVLDFYSLARGYGLAMAFQIGSVYYLLQFNKDCKLRNFIWSLAFASLAVLSNFTFLYFFAPILFAGNTIQLIKTKFNKNFLRVLLTSIVMTLILALLIYTPMVKMIEKGSLYYGGTSGFYRDTLVTLVSYSLYHPNDLKWAQVVLNVFLLILGSLGLFYFLSSNRFKSKSLSDNGMIILLITSITIVANLINHFVSGTLYLTDRTALLFFPLLILLALFFADGINYKRFKVPSVVLTMIVCMFSLVNFGMNANFRKTIVWTFDAHTEKILNKINQEGISTNKIMSIDFSWPLESSINYYTTKNKYSNLIVCKDGYNRETINFSADYYIYFDRSLDKVGYFSDKQLIRDLKKDTAWYYKSDDTYVFSRIAINAGVYK